jgi:KaiC/GvpD/RAD55 family RecA-like ATPase
MTDHLDIDVKSKVELSLDSFIGERVAVVGISGTGKSNTTAVICEEVLARGLPVTIVDIESEYWGLREKHDLLIAGAASDHLDLAVDPSKGSQLAHLVFDHNISVILSLTGYDDEARDEFLFDYLTTMWKRQLAVNKPRLLVFDEAHELVPQKTSSKLKKLIVSMVKRGRKRGLGIVVATQRPADIEKAVITQAGIRFMHRVVYSNELDLYADNIPGFPPQKIKEWVPKMTVGQAWVVANHATVDAVIRRRHTHDSSTTPKLGAMPVVPPDLKAITAEFQAIMAKLEVGRPAAVDPSVAIIADLKAQLADREAEIAHLKEQLAQARLMAVLTPPSQEGSSEFEKALQAAQRKGFNKLLAEFRRADKPLRAMIAYLMHNSTQEYLLADIAPRIGYAASTLGDNIPINFAGRLVGRRKKEGKAYWYRWTGDVYFQEKFPNLECRQLYEELLAEAVKSLKSAQLLG